jgi:site-specific DNA-methyltransferase (adenine-specific)
MNNQTILGDCFEFLSTIPDNSIDAVITDPPYGIGIAKWDTVIDIPKFTSEVKRVLKKDGFYAFFGQMPTVINWINAANEEKMKYKEHIVWVKRNVGLSARLMRCHESLFVYGNRPDFYQTKGRYEDVKFPGILFDVFTVEGFQRAYSDLMTSFKSGKIRKGNENNLRQNEFGRYGVVINKERCPDIVNFTNVWSFLPATRQEGRSQKGIYYHPCEKPLELMKRLVELVTPENALILDTFAGSGTTALACLETNRDYILIEKEPDYYEVIQKRINQWHNDRLNATGTYELPDGVERIREDKTGQLSLF